MSARKRVLLVVHRFWPHPGGSERLFYNMARRLAGRGFEVTVFTTDAWHPESYHSPRKQRLSAGLETHEGLTIRRFGLRNIPLQFKVLRVLSWLPVEVLKLLSGSPYVLVPGFLREVFHNRPKFDIIIAGVLPYTHLIYPAAWLARLHQIPWVCVPLVHTGLSGGGPSPGYLTAPQVRLLKDADAIVTVTDTESRALAASGLTPAKIHRVGVGIDPEEFAGGEAGRFRGRFRLEGALVLQVSTLSRAKGAIDLVEAMKVLWNTGSDARLVLLGPSTGDFEKYFTSQPEHIRERILMLGMTDETTKKDAFAACDLFVMASSADSFGTVYLEAWLYGKPVIGAEAGGVPDVVSQGRDGLLVRFGDHVELADAVSKLLADAELRRRLGEAGRRKVLEEFTWDAVFGRLASVLDPLLARTDDGSSNQHHQPDESEQQSITSLHPHRSLESQSAPERSQ
jgi:glycosyltransferase involved in cell wall biosynthesis